MYQIHRNELLRLGLFLTPLMLWRVGHVVAASLDQIQFGNESAEQAHEFAGEKSRVAAGGLRESCRRIEPDGAMEFRLRCAPDQQNYLTVKLWGSDDTVCTLFVGSGDRRLGRYGEALPELDLCQGGPACPGRFYYVTYALPRSLTRDREQVRLKLTAIGAIHAYAPVHQRERGLEGPSRGIYRAYLGTDPCFVPSDEERQGRAPPPKVRTPTIPASEFAAANLKAIDAAVDRILDWQLYGPRWQEAIDKGDAPVALAGAVVQGGVPKQPPRNWFDWAIQSATKANCNALKIVGIYAGAYRLEGSRHSRSPALIERILQALDFCCVAQGGNGGMTATAWAGGPKRSEAGAFIEGDGTRWLGRALTEVASDIKPESLNAKIDDDANAETPPIPRRAAYARFFARHRDFLMSPAAQGRAANQDLFQLAALWLDNEALRALDSREAWRREKMLAMIRRGVGLAPDRYGGRWVSRQGLPLEPWGTLAGGYCGNYGPLCVDLICELAELTGDDAICQRACDCIAASSRFYYPARDAEGFSSLYREGIISTRNTKWPAVPDYGLHPFAAVKLHCPEALRAFQLWIADGNQPVPLKPHAHSLSEALGRIYAARFFAALLAAPATSARLLMEPQAGDAAWADAEGQVVAIRRGDRRLYVALNWRRGFRDNRRDAEHAWANNIARVHDTAPTFDRIATMTMESIDGFGGLYLCRYGDCWIAMNGSVTKSYPISPPAGLGPVVKDLISGQSWMRTAAPSLRPMQTVVLIEAR